MFAPGAVSKCTRRDRHLGAYEAFPLVLTTPVATGNTVRLCWEPTAPTVVLQHSPSLRPAQWTDVQGSAATNCIVLPQRDSQGFFRLLNPSESKAER